MHTKRLLLLAAAALGSLLMTSHLTATDKNDAATPPSPPTAKRIEHITEIHGQKLTDNYFWLREKSNPAVISHLEAENAYTDAALKSLVPFQDALYTEMLARIKQTDLSVPYRDRGFFYYSRTVEGQQYPILCRKKGSLDAPEQITLDVNELAKGEKFMAIGASAVADDGNLLAFSTDNTGFRIYTLRIKNLSTGEFLPDKIEKVRSIAWAADNKTLFYVTEDSAKRPYRLMRHTLGSAEPDTLIFEESDERFSLGVGVTRSRAFLVLESGSSTTSEVRILPATTPAADWRLIAPREQDHEYDLDHHGDLFYIRTNSGGRNFRLVTAPVSDPARKNWKEIIPHRPNVMLQGVDTFKNHYVLFERENGLPHITITDFKSNAAHRISFPEPAYQASPSTNREYDAPTFRFSYTSFITPNSIFDYDVATRERTLLKQTEVLGGYDASQYTVERHYATAPDGVRVPISLVYKKGLKRDGSSPLFLYAYGSYGISMPVTFSSARLSLLDRGVVYALAHIRGGGEMGKAWHDDGRMMKKINTFTDFIASAEFLIAQKYTSKDRLAISGGSAGGLLMGAVTNMRPDLFKVVVSLVPFVDVLNTMLDTSLPLTVGEFEEWGNPQVKAEFDYMKTYCPYTNLAKKNYPIILVRTSINDSQVMYWEPAKYVAKLRSLSSSPNPIYFRINMAAGHGGSSGRYDALKEAAFDYAFVLHTLGISK